MRSHARAERGPGRPMPPPPAPRGTVAAGPRRRRSPETPVPGQSRPGIPRESRAASAPACGTRGVRGIGVWSAPRERLEPRSRAGRQRTRPSPSAVDSTPLEGREGREHRVQPRGPAPRTRAPGSPPAVHRRCPAQPCVPGPRPAPAPPRSGLGPTPAPLTVQSLPS